MSAFQQIANTFEILEQILLDISISRRQLLRFQRISKQFAAVINNSAPLQHRLFMRHDPDRDNECKQNPLLLAAKARLANGFMISGTKETCHVTSSADHIMIWRITHFYPWGIEIEKTWPKNEHYIVIPPTSSFLKMVFLPHDGVMQIQYSLKHSKLIGYRHFSVLFVPAYRTLGEILEFLDAWERGNADEKKFAGQLGKRHIRGLEEDSWKKY